MATILLYAPELTGHPQVYCRVIGEILLQQGHRVIISAATDADRFRDWNDLRIFSDYNGFAFVDTRCLSHSGDSHLTAEELTHLQSKMRIDSTLFIEGDWFQKEFFRIAQGVAPRLRGHNAAIFAKTCEWIPGVNAYSGYPIGPKWYELKKNLRQFYNHFRTKELSPRIFYEKTVIGKQLVDVFITKDERLINAFGPPVVWMPEIYRVFGVDARERRLEDWDKHAEALQRYVAKAGSQNILFYFGTGTRYKGYDLFLKLAENEPSIFALHAGAPLRNEDRSAMIYDVDGIRSKLIKEGRLYATDAFVDSQDLIDLLFNSIHSFVSTHRLTLSSGTMLHALEYGKPVLTPSTGLVGYRTETAGIGRTYQYMNIEDMSDSWRKLCGEDLEKFKMPIERFIAKFSKGAIAKTFLEALII